MSDDEGIVCVAPDGSLEIWRWSSSFHCWLVEDDLFFNYYRYRGMRSNPPEFWGREVLGSLGDE